MNPAFRGMRNLLALIVPKWLQNRPGFQVGFKLLWVIATVCDAQIEIALEGYRAAWPGKLGRLDTNDLIGQSRGLIQGPFESATVFESRCLNWLRSAENMGSDETLAEKIQAYFTAADGVTLPKVTVIDRAGQFTTLSPLGVFSYAVDATWSALWDGQAIGPSNWSDMWIIVYATPSQYVNYANFNDAAWTAAWHSKTGVGIGHTVPRVDSDAIGNLIANEKGAHTKIQAVIFTTNAALFVPGSLGTAGNPDGHWGNWSKVVGGNQVPARNLACRYWCSPNW